MSEDPVFGRVEDPNSLMVFGYAGGNPLTNIDPEGTAHFDPKQQGWVPDDDEKDLAAWMKQRQVSYIRWDVAMFWEGYENAIGTKDEAFRKKNFLAKLDAEDFRQNVFNPVSNAAIVTGAAVVAAPALAATAPVVAKGLLVVGAGTSAYNLTQVATGDKIDLFAKGGPRVGRYAQCNNLMTCDRMWEGVSAGSELFLSFAGGAQVSRADGGRLFTNDRAEQAGTWLEGQLNRDVQLEFSPANELNSFPRGVLPRVKLGPAPVANTKAYVYQLVDEAGDPVYYGITNDPATRLGAHSRQPPGPFRGMQVISDEVPLPQAQSLETSLIQQAKAEGRFIYNVEEQSLPRGAPALDTPPTRTPTQTLLNPKLYGKRKR